MTNHPKDAHISDSASGGKGESMAGEIRQFRKKPVVVDAVKFSELESAPQQFRDAVCTSGYRSCDYDQDGHIHTLEGVMTIGLADWIICGIKGEFYPCKPDIFATTYEAVFLRPSDAPAQGSEARPGVGSAVESNTVDEKGLASRVEELELLLREGLTYADGGWDSKRWKALVSDALSRQNGSAAPQSSEQGCGCVSVKVDDALRLLVEFVGDNFQVPRDIPHLKILVNHARKALRGGA